MIKINLLRNRGGGGAQTTTTTTKVSYETAFNSDLEYEGASSAGKNIFAKIIIMFAGVIMLMLHEYYNVNNLRAQLSDVNSKKNETFQELEKSKPIVSTVRDLQQKVLDLEARIRAIKDLSRVRLREIKVIDYIQNVIPERVWLSALEFKDEKLNIDGSAVSDDQLNRFMDAIDGKFYFRNVILLKSVEEKVKMGTIKVFRISSGLAASE